MKWDVNIQNIVTGLLNSPYHVKQEILKFQHFMYRNIMNIEIMNNEKECTALNHLASKQRRILKTITTDAIFKNCCNFLQYQKTLYYRYWGRRNEYIWKTALTDRFNRWMVQMVSNVFHKHQSDIVFINGKIALMNNLKVTMNENISIGPVMNQNDLKLKLISWTRMLKNRVMRKLR